MFSGFQILQWKLWTSIGKNPTEKKVSEGLVCSSVWLWKHFSEIHQVSQNEDVCGHIEYSRAKKESIKDPSPWICSLQVDKNVQTAMPTWSAAGKAHKSFPGGFQATLLSVREVLCWFPYQLDSLSSFSGFKYGKVWKVVRWTHGWKILEKRRNVDVMSDRPSPEIMDFLIRTNIKLY